MARVCLTTIAVALCGALGLAVPSLAAAGSIGGHVSAEGSGDPIEGIDVCPHPQPYAFETSCTETDSQGNYRLFGLPAADYIVRFSADRENLKYVSEYYEDKANFFEADLFSLGAAEDAQLDAELAEGGSISGIVKDEGTEEAIADVAACAESAAMPSRCTVTNTLGEYQINGLPAGTYRVEYEGGNRVNYLREFYEDSETGAGATDVVVTAPGTVTAGIDAKLAPGAQILGRVTEMGTGIPRRGVMVCANEQEPGEHQACAWTDSSGNYAIRSIPAGTYLVAFELEYMPFGLIADQWWQGAATITEATPIAIAPPETRSGIDGQVRELFPKPKPDPIQVSIIPRPPGPKPPPRKCKKGFHKKKVKGKVRCVRKHKRHGKKPGKGGSGRSLPSR